MFMAPFPPRATSPLQTLCIPFQNFPGPQDPGAGSSLPSHIPRESSLMVPTWRPWPYLQQSAWSLGRRYSHSTSEYSHLTMHAWDPPSPTRGQERPGLCLTYNREPGAFSEEDFSVCTVTRSTEENKCEVCREEGVLLGAWWTLGLGIPSRALQMLHRRMFSTFDSWGHGTRAESIQRALCPVF